jgi:nucleoside-diphosphate-sugar epimerase
MTTLVLGASGATGKQLVEQLLKMRQKVKMIVRSPEKVPDSWKNNDLVSIIKAGISEMSEVEMAEHAKNCDAVASCLGHNLTLKGVFGKPRRLVTDAVRLTCSAIQKNEPTVPVKFVLMNTTGNRNRDIDEPITLGHRIVIGLIRLLVPPQADNEKAADILRAQIGRKNSMIEWVIVRPDGLFNEDIVTEYTLHTSPTRSPIFDPGKTSRINVGNFMAKLITEAGLWNTWKGQMPVIYNKNYK